MSLQSQKTALLLHGRSLFGFLSGRCKIELCAGVLVPATTGNVFETAMNPYAALALTLLASYLIGAIPFGYLVARWRGVDILRQGSGNIGATNIGRVLGRRFGILVFLLDFAKGALPTAAGRITTAVSWDPDSFLNAEVLCVG